MNQLDTTHHHKNKVVVITKTDGIQGSPGKNGITPHIDKETGNWYISNVDTGVKAGGLSKNDITLLHFFDTKDYFPKEGNPKDIYIAKNSSTLYTWNAFSSEYKVFKPNYVIDLENVVSNIQLSMKHNKDVLKKPTNIIPGSLIIVDESGNTQCTNVTYDELLRKINSGCGSNCDGACCSPKNLIPGALLIGSDDGGIQSSNITHTELNAAIEDSKKSVKLSGDVVSGSLMIANEDGSIRSSGKTISELIKDIEKSSIQSDWNETNSISPAFIKNKPDVVTKKEYKELENFVNSKALISSSDIIPGTLIVADRKGNLRCSDIKYEDLVTFKNIVSGSKSDYTYIEENEVYIVTIPESVKKFPAVTVYHNGNLLMEGLHYTLNKGFIFLKGFYAYKSDIFSFVGYGSTAPSSLSNSTTIPEIPNIIAGSKSEYQSIKEDKENVITIPKSVRIFPAINVYHNGILLVEGLHYSIDRDFITLNGFFAYKNDIFNFVGYGSASLITDEQNTNHTHANKTILDTIVQERVDAWDTITTHNHDSVYVKSTEIINPALLPVAKENSAGVVKSSKGANKISVSEDGTMSVDKIDVSTLISQFDAGRPEIGEDYSLILSAGSAKSYKN